MWRLSFRFQVVHVTIGGVIMTLAAGLFGFFPGTRIIAGICFAAGILLTEVISEKADRAPGL